MPRRVSIYDLIKTWEILSDFHWQRVPSQRADLANFLTDKLREAGYFLNGEDDG